MKAKGIIPPNCTHMGLLFKVLDMQLMKIHKTSTGKKICFFGSHETSLFNNLPNKKESQYDRSSEIRFEKC